jgi:anti-sigma regulatory factor (Ser/Thr protein kinase)
MGRLRSALAAFASDTTNPGTLLSRLDRFAAGPGDVDFATACFALLDPESGLLRYASAGHPPMLLVTASGETTWLTDGRSEPLYGGAHEYRPEAAVSLEPGSLLLLYSDGLVERRRERLSAGLARLETAARVLRGRPVDEICERLLDELRPGSSQTDDVVLIGLRRLPQPAASFHSRFPARPEQLRRLRAELGSWLEAQDVSEDDRRHLLLAIGEASANAVEHAYHGATPDSVTIDVAREDRGIVASIRDLGRWREPSADGERGRGIGIMKALCTSVEVAPAAGGTTVTIRLRVGEGEQR